jgi:hypothetical protein
MKEDIVHFEMGDEDCGLVSMFFPMDAYSDLKPDQNIAIRNYQWNNIIRWQDYGW